MVKIVILITALFFLAGCASAPSLTPAERGMTEPPPTQDVVAQLASKTTLDEPVQADSTAAQVLIQFADLVTKGNTQGAANLLAPNLRGVYQMNDYAPMRNTPRMEIVRLVEMTGAPNWNADIGAREQKVVEFRLFAVDVRYKVLGIIDTYVKDGEIFHHKATVTKYTSDGPWLISELSGFGN